MARGFAAFRAERLSLSESSHSKGGYASCSASLKTHQSTISPQLQTGLQVFKTSRLKELLCEALDEARTSASFLVFAYVVMPDHLHALIGSKRKPSEVARYVNGISSRRVINYLKEAGYESSLQKLRRATGVRSHRYSLWDHHPNVKLVTTENGLMEKANYIHQNPVRAGLVAQAEDYRWSSIRYWRHCPLEDEPLKADSDQLTWHR